MKTRHSSILAGTALALLMTSVVAAGAAPIPAAVANDTTALEKLPVILAQGQDATQPAAEGEEPAADEEGQPRKRKAAPEPEPEPAPAAEAPAPQPEPEPKAEAEAPAPKPEPEPEPKAEAEAPAPQPEPEPKAEAEAPAPKEDAAPAQAETPAAPAEDKAGGNSRADRQKQREERNKERAEQKEERKQDAAEQPAAPEPNAPATAEQPAAPEPNAPATAEQPATPQADAPATAEQPVAPEPNAPATAEQPAAPEGQAPILDSQKQQPAGEPAAEGQAAQPVAPAVQPSGGTDMASPQANPTQPAQPAEAPGPVPTDDATAQARSIPQDQIQSAVAEEGKRLDLTQEQRQERRRERREQREGVEVVKQFDDNRAIIEFNNQVFIQNNDSDRIERGSRDVYYEELPRNRTREVVTRENGVQVITIRNDNGDIIRRSRIMPDKQEYVLYYVPEDEYGAVAEYRDAGADLPPLRLTIPADEYILDSESVDDAEDYYTFLDQPPVEQVRRIYSVDEVKRSARIRDTVHRVDLDTIQFGFGSADIPESEIKSIEGVAQGMAKLLEQNPAETFLIEGHTDAVGSDTANLALSDRRAESVAAALTSVFEIPAENLATQGYGEQYLKVKTEEPAAENRRVAIRRITPLVTPVARAN